MKDRLVLANWLAAGATLAEVEGASRIGLVENERFTENARRAFRLIWVWSVPRLGGIAGSLQERYYQRCGREALSRRHARARQWAERLASAA